MRLLQDSESPEQYHSESWWGARACLVPPVGVTGSGKRAGGEEMGGGRDPIIPNPNIRASRRGLSVRLIRATYRLPLAASRIRLPGRLPGERAKGWQRTRCVREHWEGPVYAERMRAGQSVRGAKQHRLSSKSLITSICGKKSS